MLQEVIRLTPRIQWVTNTLGGRGGLPPWLFPPAESLASGNNATHHSRSADVEGFPRGSSRPPSLLCPAYEP